jgi:hypothetical protein
MDWGLFGKYSIITKPASEHLVLRTTLHFQRPLIYYFAMIFNTVARFLWILRLWNFGTNNESVDVFLALAEITRRWIWVFFRLEKEWVVVNTYSAIDSPEMEELDVIEDLQE